MERADKDLAFLLRYENVAWFEDGEVRILDRRIYPAKVEFVTCRTHQEVARAKMCIRDSGYTVGAIYDDTKFDEYADGAARAGLQAVSYTHLDVYKRQGSWT